MHFSYERNRKSQKHSGDLLTGCLTMKWPEDSLTHDCLFLHILLWKASTNKMSPFVKQSNISTTLGTLCLRAFVEYCTTGLWSLIIVECTFRATINVEWPPHSLVVCVYPAFWSDSYTYRTQQQRFPVIYIHEIAHPIASFLLAVNKLEAQFQRYSTQAFIQVHYEGTRWHNWQCPAAMRCCHLFTYAAIGYCSFNFPLYYDHCTTTITTTKLAPKVCRFSVHKEQRNN